MLSDLLASLRLRPGVRVIDPEAASELATLDQDARSRYFVGVEVRAEEREVVLFRGNGDVLIVPFAWFTSECPVHGVGSAKSGPAPDFADPEIADFGQTVRFGEWEAAGDAILACYDDPRPCLLSSSA